MKEKTKERIDITIDKELKKKLKDLGLNVSRVCNIALTAYVHSKDPSRAIQEQLEKYEEGKKEDTITARKHP